ncbi:T9SS type A sorting domain-containing protein [bacterium]|nr:T9SS type A sorting domain-containing protein [bacterium]
MKKVSAVFFALVALIGISSLQHLSSYSGGAQNMVTGSPASGGQTCTNCHSGPALSTQTVSISTNIPPAGFQPNTNYTITVTAQANGAAVGKIGFMSSVEGGGSHQGTISSTSTDTWLPIANFITHTSSGNTPSAGSRTWTFQWNSGSAPSGTTIYTAVNFADGTGGTGGDVITTAQLSLTQAPPVTGSDLVITGIVDGPLTGGTPKAIEIYVLNAVSDLSVFSVANANNGGTFTLTPFVFPAVPAAAGSRIYLASEAPGFTAYFGFAPDYVSSVMNINGDDVVGLFNQGTLVDVFGTPGVDGTGTPWEYTDGWAYRVSGTGPNPVFTLTEWIFSGIDALDNTVTNAAASNPFPIGTYVGGSAALPQLEITEVMSESGLGGVLDAEWFEIANVGAVPVDLNGWSWDDATNTPGAHTFGSLTLAPGARIVVGDWASASTPAWLAEWYLTGSGLQVVGTDQFNTIGFSAIDNTGDQLYLYEPNNTLHNTVVVGAPTSGVSHTYAGGTSTGASAVGVGGAYASIGGDIASPGNLSPNIPSAIPTYALDQIDGVDPVTGVADSLLTYCRVYGTIFTIDFDGNAGYSFWIHDGTGGINVFSFVDVGTFAANVGDSIKVVGEIEQFNGLIEIVPDTMVVINTGNSIGSPTVVTQLNESTESEYVQIVNVSLVTPSQWPAAGASANVDVTDGTNTFLIRIDSDTDIDGSTAPSGLFSVRGVGGQFDNTSPYTSGYQIQPSSLADIQAFVPTTPTINFVGGSQSFPEAGGSTQIQLSINPPATTSGTVVLTVTPGPGFGPTDANTLPTTDPNTGEILMPFAVGDSLLTLTVNVVDDTDQEGNENAVVGITNSGSLTTGPLSNYTFTILDNDIPIPTYSIAQVTAVDAVGLPDSMGVYCRIQGVVHGFNVQNPNGTNAQFTVIDATGGLSAFYSLNNVPYSPTEGDLVRIVGTIDQFNGLTEILPDSITLISAGNPTATPLVVTQLIESTESELIRINNLTLVTPSQWPSPGSNANIDVTDGVNLYVMRIDVDTDVDDVVLVPTGAFDLIGIGTQFDNSNPYTTGYQIIPRYAQDVLLPQPPALAITEIMPGSNLSDPNLNGDWFEITNTGATPVDLAGLGFDDNTFTPNTAVLPSYVMQPGSSVVVWEGNAANEAAFVAEWSTGGPYEIIAADELASGFFQALGQSGDAVVLYDPVAGEICRAEYINALPGVSVEFDSDCQIVGNSVPGAGLAWVSSNGDIGSPGNLYPWSTYDAQGLVGKIYPNPATDRLTIELNSAERATITVVDMVGREVYRVEDFRPGEGLSVASWAKGLYTLRIVQQGHMATHKFSVR